ncbi:hypothetical protein KK120_07635 [Virgibacillus dakarensis]|nr:hypothetical protein [Virgibacillus dakarensis]
MIWKFNRSALDKILDEDEYLKCIVGYTDTLTSPYDGITFYTERFVTDRFMNLVKPAMYYNSKHPEDVRYQYFLRHPLFIIQWGRVYNHLPNTIIRINPDRNNLNPSQVLDLLKYLVGGYSDTEVAKWDEKVDITEFLPNEVAERLYVPYQRKQPKNRKNQNSTYYYGKRNGQQVKVYNKAKQLKLKGCQLTRIEKTIKKKKFQRASVEQFFLDKNSEGFNKITMVDLDKIDGRSKVIRLIKSNGSLVGAFKQLSRREQQDLKKHKAFREPCLDINGKLQRDLEAWMNKSALLRLKILVGLLSPIYNEDKREKLSNNGSTLVTLSNFNAKGYFLDDTWSGNEKEPYQKDRISLPLPL